MVARAGRGKGKVSRKHHPARPALDRLVDDLFRRLRLGLFVTGRAAAGDMDQFVHEGDEQDDESAGIADVCCRVTTRSLRIAVLSM